MQSDPPLQSLPQGSDDLGHGGGVGRVGHFGPREPGGKLRRVPETNDVPGAPRKFRESNHQQKHAAQQPLAESTADQQRHEPHVRPELLGEEKEEQRGRETVQGRPSGKGGRNCDPLRLLGTGKLALEVRDGGPTK